ncbi:MAG: hypothetical protein WC644_01840 [Ignavibacteria bacterium]
MTSKEISDTLKRFKWNNLNRIYGCAHSSIIGFLSYEWISLAKENSVLDGAPSPIIKQESGRKGQNNSDLLLCKASKPLIPVEVETSVIKYKLKLDSLNKYIDNFADVKFGLLYMSNLVNGNKKYKHNWDSIKSIITQKRRCIALVSAEKAQINFEDKNNWSKLLKRNDYNKWEIVNINYWIHDEKGNIAEGNLYSK